ncbi:serine hydrolase [Williamsia sp. DF01-3]|uniref:serine hydrolase n=1 Tax=Williamsia sp. DF01-3 TaxID=2934157 RepID=UPI001FF45A7B|nr:serine hydrolase [Williamsia sp. DF01-3]MCK0518341.1 class A beta-lactamase-related serine hydrolase [Williamsia sp. DF01-3]
MSARPSSLTSTRPVRIVVAVAMIAVQLVLTASVGAFVCGVGSARDVDGHTPAGSVDRRSVVGGFVGRAVAAAETVAMARPGLDLGMAVLDTGTGESSGSASATPMYAASLTKLVVVVDIVERRRAEQLPVTDSDVALIERALGLSDDVAMNELWTRLDGQGAVSRVSERLGLTQTQPPQDASYWGEMVTSAADVVRIYEHVSKMPEPDRQLILGALASAPAVAADGFSQDFGLLAPGAVNAPVVKQGWMCCFEQTAYLHSAGLVGPERRFVVALLSRQPYDESWATSRDGLTAVASAVGSALSLADNDTTPLDSRGQLH